MHRPAPGGSVRSAHADTETISATSTFMTGVLVGESPDFDERPRYECLCSALLICTKMILKFHLRK